MFDIDLNVFETNQLEEIRDAIEVILENRSQETFKQQYERIRNK